VADYHAWILKFITAFHLSVAMIYDHMS